MFSYTKKKIELQSGLELAYIEEGEKNKNVLLFIHGLANYANVWHFNIDELKNNFRCIALDLAGCGESSHGDFPHSIEFHVELIQSFSQALKIKKVHLIGHSFGGQIACMLALRNESLVNSLSLIAPSGFERYTSSEAWMVKSAMQMGQWLDMDESHLSQMIKSSFYKQSSITKMLIEDLCSIIEKNNRTYYQKMIDRSMFSMMNTKTFEQLPEINQPCLVIFGAQDELIPNHLLHPAESTRSIAEKGTQQLKNAQLEMIPQAGHFVFIEKAKEVNNALLNFLPH
jgi:pimeloyl-ACP methyl ester carboxylesterase